MLRDTRTYTKVIVFNLRYEVVCYSRCSFYNAGVQYTLVTNNSFIFKLHSPPINFIECV